MRSFFVRAALGHRPPARRWIERAPTLRTANPENWFCLVVLGRNGWGSIQWPSDTSTLKYRPGSRVGPSDSADTADKTQPLATHMVETCMPTGEESFVLRPVAVSPWPSQSHGALSISLSDRLRSCPCLCVRAINSTVLANLVRRRRKIMPVQEQPINKMYCTVQYLRKLDPDSRFGPPRGNRTSDRSITPSYAHHSFWPLSVSQAAVLFYQALPSHSFYSRFLKGSTGSSIKVPSRFRVTSQCHAGSRDVYRCSPCNALQPT